MMERSAIEADDMLEKGWQLFQVNDLDGSEECFTEALNGLNELVSKTFFCLGNIACRRSEYLKALDYLARARDTDPCLPEAYSLTAEIYLALNETEKAKEWCEKALEVNWNCREAHFILARIALPGPNYDAILKMIHEYLRPRTYLEIGVETGKTLRFAGDDTLGIGVDPKPIVNVELGRLTKVYKSTSDDFFKQIDLMKEFDGNSIELAFIDGMHHFEFALRDFINIERYCDKDSVVLIHDCYPLDDITSSRERITSFWSGDIWKLIVCLKRYRPELCINVVGAHPTGLAIVTGLNKESQILADNLETIYREFIDMDYEYLNEDKAGILNLIPNDWGMIRNLLAGGKGGNRS